MRLNQAHDKMMQLKGNYTYDNDNYFQITEELLSGITNMGFWLKVRK